MAENNIGKITQIIGAVLDIKYSDCKLPEINTAIEVYRKDGEKLVVEVAQHLGDVKPDQLATKAGFMTGFDDEFLSAIGPIKVTTALNTVTDKDLGNTEDTYDTFFLPSLEQMYAKPQLAGVEGDYFEYWKRATNATKPNEWYEAGKNPGYLTYGIDAKTSPQSVRLRSAHRSGSYSAWNVYSSGYFTFSYTNYAGRCAPVCAVY